MAVSYAFAYITGVGKPWRSCVRENGNGSATLKAAFFFIRTTALADKNVEHILADSLVPIGIIGMAAILANKKGTSKAVVHVDVPSLEVKRT